jgi:two-component system response regulator HydG
MDRVRVLVVDDEPRLLRAWKEVLRDEEFEVHMASSGAEALSALDSVVLDVALVDVEMPGLGGLEVLRAMKQRWPQLEVIMVEGAAGVDVAVEAIKTGAFDFLGKPPAGGQAAALAVRRAAERGRLAEQHRGLAAELEERGAYQDLVGRSPKMLEVFRLIESVAQSATSVLLQGESGTGKELVARAIHVRSARSDQPFVAINCSALTETLLESELFGHTRGAFTGAVAPKKGLFEAADGGTLFLDEIGDIPPSTQVKLLRVLQEGEIKPVGSADFIRVDVRIIAATNLDLTRAKERGAFREDLYYRLNVITVQMPPLRARPEDIPLLACHFLQRAARKLERQVSGIAPEAMEALVAYRWVGNVRELENVMERAVVLGRGESIQLGDLPPPLRSNAEPPTEVAGHLTRLQYRRARDLALASFERSYVTALMRRASGNVSQAARHSGLDRSNFRLIMRRTGVKPEEFK